MKRNHNMAVAVGISALSLGMGANWASGQDYPSKPVRVLTGGVGSSTDFASRLIAQGLSGLMGQPVVVDNRPTGVIPGMIVSQAPPDGYTLLIYASSLWMGPFFEKAPYDPVKDFLPISMTGRQPNILVVHPSLPVNSVKELIALAKARPGDLNFSRGGTGGSGHLAAELFKAMASVNIVGIPYTNGTTEIADLLSGRVQLTFGTASEMLPHIKSGRLHAVAVTSAQPSPLVPGLPTVAASGLPGYESGSYTGLFAPAGTPAGIVSRLNQEVVRVLRMPEVKEKFLNVGVEAVGSSPEEYAAKIKSEVARWGKVIKDAGIGIK